MLSTAMDRNPEEISWSGLASGRAAEIARRWGREALVLPHPHVVPFSTMEAAQERRGWRTGETFRVGLHVKSLRASMAPMRLLPTLVDTVAQLPGAVLQVNGHRDVLDPDGARRDESLAAYLHEQADAGRLELHVHDFLDDRALWAYLASLDVSVLPYRFGTHSGWLEACRDLVSLIRYSLPRGVEVFADIPAGESVLKHRSADLRRLIVLTAIDSAKEINLGGQMKISAREAEDSVVFEVETRPGPQGFSPVDDVGLQDCRTLCKSMGGHLVYWTETERRVRLINLPTAPARAEKSPESGFRPSGQEGKGKTILLVDDEESIRSIGRSALSKFGYSVLTAKDGVEGVEKFRKHQSEIDLVVLDLVMPNMGGAGCFEKIKEMDPGVRGVLMSGFTRNRRVNDLMSRGCLFFLRKPFDLKELHSAVRDAILHSRA